MGFMQDQSPDISEIVTETSTEPLPIIIRGWQLKRCSKN